MDSLNTISCGGNVNIQIGEITLESDSGNIKWPFIKMPNRLMPTAYLQTEPIKISADMKYLTAKLDVQLDKFSLKNTSPAQKLFNFEVIDAVTQKPLKSLKALKLGNINYPNFTLRDSLRVNIREFKGKTIFLRMQTVNNLFSKNAPQITDILDFKKGHRETN